MRRVGQLCSRVNTRVLLIPYFVGPGGQTRYEAQVTAIDRVAVRSLAAISAPASVATEYAEFVRLTVSAMTDVRLAQAAAAGNQRAKGRRFELDAVNASQGASLVARELDLGYCSYDVEPARFIGRTEPQRLTAQLDQACAPAVAADEDSKLDEVFAGEQRRAGKITQRALLQQLAIAFDNAGSSTNGTARDIAHLNAPASLRPTLHDLVVQLQTSSALFINTAVAMNDARPVDLPEVASALVQIAHRAGRDAAKFKAIECEGL